MSSPLAVKRRRLNNATNTLAKPFVSPLRKSSTTKVPLIDNRNAINTTPYTPSTLAHTIKPSVSPASPPPKPTANPSTTRSTPIRKQPLPSKRTDPTILAAQKSLTTLELHLKTLRNEIDTLSQAATLRTTTTDAELESLAQKWKLASQSAAEELFGTVKERVNRMGGTQAWRDSERAKFERRSGFGREEAGEEEDDADCEFDSQGEELPEGEVEWRKKQKRRARREAEDAADVDVGEVEEDAGGTKQVWMEQGGDDDVGVCLPLVLALVLTDLQSFTMAMMLRSLNIDLVVIGYEKDAQRWIT